MQLGEPLFPLLTGCQQHQPLPLGLRMPRKALGNIWVLGHCLPVQASALSALSPSIGTSSLPSLPLLKCQNSDKPVIFLQSAKSLWTNHKTCSKGHIHLALLFVSALSLALISGDLFLQIWQDAFLGCEQPVLPLSFVMPLLALPVPASLLSQELPQTCFPPGQEIRFAAQPLFPA